MSSWCLVSPVFYPVCAFSLADFALYPFTVVNHSHEYDYILSSLSPSESQNLGVVLGTSDTAPLHNHCLIFVQHLFKGEHEPGEELGQRKGLWWHSSPFEQSSWLETCTLHSITSFLQWSTRQSVSTGEQ